MKITTIAEGSGESVALPVPLPTALPQSDQNLSEMFFSISAQLSQGYAGSYVVYVFRPLSTIESV